MNKPGYLHVDGDGDELKIRQSAGPDGVVIEVSSAAQNGFSVFVSKAESLTAAAALLEAAGWDPSTTFVVSDQSGRHVAEPANTRFGILKVEGNEVVLTSHCNRCDTPDRSSVTAAAAHEIGMLLIRMARHAVSAPDPGDVAEVAAVLQSIYAAPGRDTRVALDDKAIAEGLLRHFNLVRK